MTDRAELAITSQTTLRVVGPEPADTPRREALANIEAAGWFDRTEIRGGWDD
jgi:hypothetical protein